jgi:hypothetical protein
MNPTNSRFNFRGIAANDQPFRGLARDVASATTVDEALDAAGWNWTVHKVPYLMHGRAQDLPSRYYALVRGDNLYEIAPCSADYRPVQNRALMSAFMGAAGAAGIKLTRTVSLYGGARLFATAEMPLEFTLESDTVFSNGVQAQTQRLSRGEVGRMERDTTVLELVMSTGHEPGYKARVSARVRRLVCDNGMTITAALGSATVTHRGNNAELKLRRVAEVISSAVEGFGLYRRQAEILRATPSSPAMDRAYVVQLLDDAAWQAIVAETEARVHSAHPGKLAGTDLLNAVVEETYTQRFETALQTRSLAAVLDAIQSQPGAAMARGTLWNTFNGVTYQVDHRAGRNLDAAVESSLMGTGDRIKRSALDLALTYAEAAGNRGVRGGRLVQ